MARDAQPQLSFRMMRTAAFLLLPIFVAAGCSGGEGGATGPQLGLSCVDDSSHCITQRGKVFDSYMSDKSRSWLKQPASAEAYASGVRLFAMSKKRKELTCEELAHGRREAEAGPGVLRSSGGKLTPAQVSRGVMLAGEVARDLSREQDRRCRKT